MIRLFNPNGSSDVAHADVVFKADEHNVVEVPEELEGTLRCHGFINPPELVVKATLTPHVEVVPESEESDPAEESILSEAIIEAESEPEVVDAPSDVSSPEEEVVFQELEEKQEPAPRKRR